MRRRPRRSPGAAEHWRRGVLVTVGVAISGSGNSCSWQFDKGPNHEHFSPRITSFVRDKHGQIRPRGSVGILPVDRCMWPATVLRSGNRERQSFRIDTPDSPQRSKADGNRRKQSDGRAEPQRYRMRSTSIPSCGEAGRYSENGSDSLARIARQETASGKRLTGAHAGTPYFIRRERIVRLYVRQNNSASSE